VSFYIKKVSQQDWNMLSKDAHMISFGVIRDPSLDRISFALIAVDNQGEVSGYVTCVEMDSETLYWQHGGAMPARSTPSRGTVSLLIGVANTTRESPQR
jgi:hypothetical protein